MQKRYIVLVAKFIMRDRKYGVYVVRAKRERVSLNWFQNYEYGSVERKRKNGEEWKREEVGDTNNREMILDEWSNIKFLVKKIVSSLVCSFTHQPQK